jgi:hypothetical protein
VETHWKRTGRGLRCRSWRGDLRVSLEPLAAGSLVGPGRRHRGAARSAEGPEAYTYATTG